MRLSPSQIKLLTTFAVLVIASPAFLRAATPPNVSTPDPCPLAGTTAAKCPPAATLTNHNLVLYGAKQIIVTYVNPFRFDLSALINSTSIAAAAIPTGLGVSPSSTAAAASATGQTHSTASPIPLTSSLTEHDARVLCTDDNLNSSDPATQKATVASCWTDDKTQEKSEIAKVAGLRTVINVAIRSVADEQHCYLVALKNYSQPILSLDQARSLVNFAAKNGTSDQVACYKGPTASPDSWPSDDADTAVSRLTSLLADLTDLGTAPGFGAWSAGPGNQAAYTAMLATVTNLLSEVTSYATRTSSTGGTAANIGHAFSDFQTALDNNQSFRYRLAGIAASAAVAANNNPEFALVLSIPLNPCAEWYGKGRIDTITLQYSDVTSTAGATPPSVSLGTNTCTPLSIASTGIGVTFNANPVYDFVPVDNTGALVIGETAKNDKAPLYAVLYNVHLLSFGSKAGLELFASPGVGLTSSSNSTTTDFLGGLSIALARRLLFITPSIDFGRRDQLSPGFTLGTPKGSLSAVPTQTHWQAQFMISISFGIGSS